MSIHSMTAYARHEVKAEWGSAVWEIRSVNQRYLETFLRLPEQFRGLEPVLRERFRKAMQRGKIECGLRYDFNKSDAGQMVLNEDLAKEVIHKARWITDHVGGSMHVNPLDVLNWPGVMNAPEQDLDIINQDVLAGFNEALAQFLDARASEGEALKGLIDTRLSGVAEQVTIVRNNLPAAAQWQRDRIMNRLAEAKVDLDPGRLEQEMAMLAQKSDVAEELDRLDTHIAECKKITKKGGACGRRLDFMMQEFNREANTLGSKSITAEITQASVELKVLIEQMREQIQNIE
ncbi:YicC/YloC family endoribonuclease [Echinimonas agarilytica]|uniref:YicC family protein n=1 Tax=Echinimonas agarilytica TaxID=1215918 RepID=A0AA42B987_9GAMM|nr:YicC/YloC family endoribonuclease [Echinimonas agarilytica]MCM2680951.1 YicC family protein [Echinimonas agarilytica]